MKVIHIITDLVLMGGAEVSLFNLVSNMDRETFQNEVITLTDFGPVADLLKGIDVPVSKLGMKMGIPSLSGLLKLSRLLKEKKPDLIQSWMPHSNLITTVSMRLSGISCPVIWGIRQSKIDPAVHGWKTIGTIRLCGKISRSRFAPSAILCNADACIQAHEPYGFIPDGMTVIPNGFDTSIYKPDPDARKKFRAEIGVSEDTCLIGLLARFDASKNHSGFVEAAGIIGRKRPDIHFVLCGFDIGWDNEELAGYIKKTGIEDRFHLMGRRLDLNAIEASLDILVSSSTTEAFSRVIGEAMSCEVPCVVTDVGDSAAIVGETGLIAPPDDTPALVAAIEKMIELPIEEKKKLGSAARNRIIKEFSIDNVVDRYQELYKKTVTQAGKIKN